MPAWVERWCDRSGRSVAARPTDALAVAAGAGDSVLIPRAEPPRATRPRVVAAVRSLPDDAGVLVDALDAAAHLDGLLVVLHGVPLSFGERSVGRAEAWTAATSSSTRRAPRWRASAPASSSSRARAGVAPRDRRRAPGRRPARARRSPRGYRRPGRARRGLRRAPQFWGKLLLINFAMGVVTGIVQEFQFGMDWSDYSRFVGDIFGAPLAIEGLLAFFLESTFLGLWTFGWDRLPKRVHLACIWLASVGTLLSAYFILAANPAPIATPWKRSTCCSRPAPG